MFIRTFAAAGLILGLLGQTIPTVSAGEATMTDDQVKIFITSFETAMNTGTAEAADRLLAPGFTDHDPWPGQTPDAAGFKAGLAEMRTGFPDLNVKVERVVAQGDHLAVQFRNSGTQLGPFMGSTPSGKTFNIQGIDINRVSNGQIAEHWGVIDAAAMMGQLAP